MWVSVLGPIEVTTDDGSTRPIGAPKERAVLAALCAQPDEVVAADRLVDALWGDRPPATARKTLQTYVLHLRRLLGDRIVHQAPGYRLRVEAAELDALGFEQLAGSGRHALLRGDLATAVADLGAAVALWRGEPFEGVDPVGAVETEALRLARLRDLVEEDLIEARLLSGVADALVPELEAMTAEAPLRERLWALLIRALDRAGRRADALRAYQRARQVLIDEVGIGPGPELLAAEAAVLRGDRHIGHDGLEVSYVTNLDGLRIAYATRGTGERVVVLCAEWTMNLELLGDLVELRPFLDGLSDDARLVVVQRRGSALSDREPDRFAPPEECVGDVDAVLDHLGCPRVSLIGWGHGGQIATAYAARRPDRVSDLTVVSGYLQLRASDDHPSGLAPEACEAFLAVMETMWGMPQPKHGIFSPEMAVDPEVIARITRMERLTSTPREAVDTQRAVQEFDVRALAPLVACPSLVVHLRESITGQANALDLAAALHRAEFVEVPGHFVPTHDEAEVVAATIRDFHIRVGGTNPPLVAGLPRE